MLKWKQGVINKCVYLRVGRKFADYPTRNGEADSQKVEAKNDKK